MGAGSSTCASADEDVLPTPDLIGKCWKMTAIGSPSDPALLQDLPRPVPAVAPNQVLVKVAAAALNPIDYKLMQGKVKVMASPPFVAGKDFAGTVHTAGSASGFAVGDEVFGDANVGLDTAGGSLSTYLLVSSDIIAKKPTSMSMEEASSISLVGQTVLDCLAKASPKEGARVLILGASGGVGTSAVQICKARGLHVIGVCSGANAELVGSLGADEVIDYTQQDWSASLAEQKVQVVFDFAPSGASSVESWDKSRLVLEKGGQFITISGHDPEGAVTVSGIMGGVAKTVWRNTFGDFKYYLVLKKSEAAKLQQLAALVDEGKLRAVVDQVFPWDEVHAAFAKLMSGRAKGKLVVTVGSTDAVVEEVVEAPKASESEQ